MTRRTHAIPVLLATQDSPTFARLAELARDSAARLQSIQSLIPANLRSCVTAGPINGATWCLLLDNTATAAKLRQMTPTLQAHLRSQGWDVDAIRLKVRSSPSR